MLLTRHRTFQGPSSRSYREKTARDYAEEAGRKAYEGPAYIRRLRGQQWGTTGSVSLIFPPSIFYADLSIGNWTLAISGACLVLCASCGGVECSHREYPLNTIELLIPIC